MSGRASLVHGLVRSHADGNEALFWSHARAIAAEEEKVGHVRIAADLTAVIDRAAGKPGERKASGLMTVTTPATPISDLVVSGDTLRAIKRVITEHRHRGLLEDHGFSPASRLLFVGPPGTGKTMTAQVIATEMDLPLMTVRLDAVVDSHLGASAANLAKVFADIGTEPAVYLFDEFDALGGDRGRDDVGEARRILNSILMFLEGTAMQGVVIAATNYPSLLDKALFRRFDMRIDYGLPSTDQAYLILRKRLGPLARGVHLNPVMPLIDGMSHAELVRAAETAAKMAILSGETTVGNALADVLAATDKGDPE